MIYDTGFIEIYGLIKSRERVHVHFLMANNYILKVFFDGGEPDTDT